MLATPNGKQLYETNSGKYLGIRIDNRLNWKAHINDIALKLIRATAMLYKVWDFFDAGILKTNYHCPIWVTYSLCMYYMGTECVHNQSTFYTSKESIKIDSF